MLTISMADWGLANSKTPNFHDTDHDDFLRESQGENLIHHRQLYVSH